METITKQTHVTGKEGAAIALKTAVNWTANHRERNPGGLVSHQFGHETIHAILDQPDCVGLRIYYANSVKLNGWQKFLHGVANIFINAAGGEGQKHLLLTGVNSDGTDQLPADVVAADETELTFTAHASGGGTGVVDQSAPCPGSPGCPSNALSGR